ncbi:hypothetical protein PIB30_034689 [Stylosanthes scabra]|uniref:Receptor-like serine/threonine-protein kinase n=1 Tax=Stylosanthes scabra TaxID=79078 RepID=A0ABU6SD35_9FABA|nr:hypothetical protein [Stylosanthes scabra]
MTIFFSRHLLILTTFFFITPSTSSDTLTATQILTTNQTLISQNQTFVLGFFRRSITNYYLGIWYNNITPQTIVWVANRDNPIHNSSGYLKLGDHGNFLLLNSSGNLSWSSNETTAKNPLLQLLDTGNLVLKDSSHTNNNNNYLWQSFDYPTDTVLPGMEIGWNFDTGMEKHLTSWKITGEDPSSGDYTMKLDYHGLPEGFLRRDNQTIIFRAGPWNGEGFSGITAMKDNTDGLKFNFNDDEHGVMYYFTVTKPSLLSRIILTSDGEFERYMWLQASWNKFWYQPGDQCDYYGVCGPYGVCDNNASPNMKLPETANVFVNKSMTLDECESLCKRNCSCTAYANIDITNGGTGCVMWVGQLFDMSVYPSNGQDLYVRLSASDIGTSKNHRVIEAIGITLGALVIVLGLVAICYLRNKRQQRSRGHDSLMNEIYSGGVERNMDDLELPMFDFDTLTMATNNFSQDNKLGEGGFGSVYRGRLIEGREIAVKRLSEDSRQGIQEFKNEVKLIIKLQHRNLVRLLGCCIEKDEKMLVYEYMENRGLDSILFDKSKRALLNWERRFNIIYGIGRGLVYLHQDSRFRIIHRDLKTSNILLDGDMNPKISDFGLARIFDKDEIQTKTLRIVGTYGYMAPEYAMYGKFSIKSDVFSFGVMILEIITGKKNRWFSNDKDEESNLLENVWRHWHKGTVMTLVDPSISNSCTESEVVRCIHIGLLCIQERAEDRPTMSSVVLMLSNEAPSMSNPKSPGFSARKTHSDMDSSSSRQDETWSVNEVTITVLDAR